MGIEQLLDTEREFLVVRHRVLNNPKVNFEQEVDQMRKELKGCTSGREIIPVFEGDYFFPSWSNVIMAHGSFEPGELKFGQLREQCAAAYLEEVLEAYSVVKHNLGKVVLCFEAKVGTSDDGTRELLRTLAISGISNVYIDSFFAARLIQVKVFNQEGYAVKVKMSSDSKFLELRKGVEWKVQRADYSTSFHLAGTVGPFCVGMPCTLFPRHVDADIITVPYVTSFGSNRVQSVPRIYGAVTKKDYVAHAADEKNVIGVYWRGDEKSSVRTFLNSFGAKKNF